jgi:hypothetical protein
LFHGQTPARVAKEVRCALRRQLKLVIDGVVLSRREVAGRVKQQPQASGTRLSDAIDRAQIRSTFGKGGAEGAPCSEKTTFIVWITHWSTLVEAALHVVCRLAYVVAYAMQRIAAPWSCLYLYPAIEKRRQQNTEIPNA